MEEKQRENRKRIKVRLAFYGTSQDLVDMLQLGHSLVFRLFGCFVFFFLSGLEYLSIQGKKEKRKYGW